MIATILYSITTPILAQEHLTLVCKHLSDIPLYSVEHSLTSEEQVYNVIFDGEILESFPHDSPLVEPSDDNEYHLCSYLEIDETFDDPDNPVSVVCLHVPTTFT